VDKLERMVYKILTTGPETHKIIQSDNNPQTFTFEEPDILTQVETKTEMKQKSHHDQ